MVVAKEKEICVITMTMIRIMKWYPKKDRDAKANIWKICGQYVSFTYLLPFGDFNQGDCPNIKAESSEETTYGDANLGDDALGDL